MIEFNTIKPIGSIYEEEFRKKSLGTPTTKLVNIIAHILNPNHFHFILEQVSDKGIEKFMQKLGGGYTRYFNVRHSRNGVLFQGKFKSVHIDSDEYLLYLSAYVNLNDRIHKLPDGSSFSSWNEYLGQNQQEEICLKDIILDRFKDKEDYRKFAEDTAETILIKREEDERFSELLLE